MRQTLPARAPGYNPPCPETHPGLGIALADDLSIGNWDGESQRDAEGHWVVPPFTSSAAMDFIDAQLEPLLVKLQGLGGAEDRAVACPVGPDPAGAGAGRHTPILQDLPSSPSVGAQTAPAADEQDRVVCLGQSPARPKTIAAADPEPVLRVVRGMGHVPRDLKTQGRDGGRI